MVASARERDDLGVGVSHARAISRVAHVRDALVVNFLFCVEQRVEFGVEFFLSG